MTPCPHGRHQSQGLLQGGSGERLAVDDDTARGKLF